jgi:hypothetical protein
MKTGDLVQWVERSTTEADVILNGLILYYRQGISVAQVLIPDAGVAWRSVRTMEVIDESR